MDILNCKTPDMVIKEIWVHLLAYNIVRRLMALSAEFFGLIPRKLSFAGAIKNINAYIDSAKYIGDEKLGEQFIQLLLGIATHKIGSREGRKEPSS